MSTTIRPPIHIGQVICNAIAFNPETWQEPAMPTADLLQTVARLFAMLKTRRVDYVLVGGIALLHYIEGRNTEDIDLIIAAAALEALPEIVITSQDANFARGKFDGLQIDCLFTRNRLFEHVQRHHTTTQTFVEQAIPCATVAGLLLLKLYALPALYRQRNFARVGLYENDIATLLHAYRPDLAPLFAELTPHLSATDLTAVREIVTDIEGRIARFGH